MATLNADGVTLNLVGVGTVVVTAMQAGNTNYEAATPVTQTITVNKGEQTITFAPPGSGTVGTTIELVATGGASGNPVTFSITAGDATLNGNMLTLTGVGSVTVTATQAGNANYAEGTRAQTITVNQGTQDINFTSAGAGRVGEMITLMATGGVPGRPVRFSISSGGGLATLDGGTNILSLEHVGTVTITATRAVSPDYAATTQTQTITVSKGTQEIMFTPPATGPVGTNIVLMATGGDSGNNVTFSISSGGGLATFDGTNTLRLEHVGDVTVTARQAGNSDYEAAPEVQQIIRVTQGTQTIRFTSDAAGQIGDIIALMATASSGLGVTFEITGEFETDGTTPTADGSVATLSGGNNLTLVGIGKVTITATQAGNADYAEVTKTQDIAVSAVLTPQTITFTTPVASPATGNVGVPITLAATAGPGLNVTFEITAETRLGAPVPARTVATLEADGVTLNLVGAGTVVITARQAGGVGDGGVIYAAAADVEQTINVSPGTQTITFTTPATSPATSTVGTTIELVATSSAGLGVTFEITEVRDTDDNVVTGVAADAVATLADGSTTLRLTGVGTVEVTATSDDNVNYILATQMQTITVSKGSQIITFTTPATSPATSTVGTTIELVATFPILVCQLRFRLRQGKPGQP